MPPKAAKQAAAKAPPEDVEEQLSKLGPKMPWSGELHPTNAIPGRCYHVAALWDGKLILVGGWDGTSASSSVENSNNNTNYSSYGGGRPSTTSTLAATGTTTQLAATANGVHQSQRLPAPHHNEISQFDFATSTWSVLDTTGDHHPGTSQTASADVGSALLFYGGWDGNSRSGALTLLMLEHSQWKPFETTGDVSPPPTTFHTANAVNKRFYVYGGNTVDGQTGDMWLLDLQTTTWQLAQAIGAPGKRSSHTATIVNDTYIVITGGRGGADGTSVLSDVAVFDTTNNHWVIGVKVEGSMSARYGHSATAVGNRLVIFGGIGSDGSLLNDIWVMTMEKPNLLTWVKIEKDGPAPVPRTGHAALESMCGMYVVGGRTDGTAHVTSDIYTMDLGPIAPLPPPIEGDEGDTNSEMGGTPPPM